MTLLNHPPVSDYTPEDHHVWNLLFKRQLAAVRQYSYTPFTKGIEILGFTEDRIPDFAETNRRLKNLNGWSVYPVPGLISNADFFREMAAKRFGITSWIRQMKELDYLEEPDLFHDAFGHIPMLTDEHITDFLLGLAKLVTSQIDNESLIESVSRLYWYTVEFGLVREQEALKIYGAGIISSVGETRFVMSPESNCLPFDLKTILQTPYIKDKFQSQYFVLESLEQLKPVMKELTTLFTPASSSDSRPAR